MARRIGMIDIVKLNQRKLKFYEQLLGHREQKIFSKEELLAFQSASPNLIEEAMGDGFLSLRANSYRLTDKGTHDINVILREILFKGSEIGFIIRRSPDRILLPLSSFYDHHLLAEMQNEGWRKIDGGLIKSTNNFLLDLSEEIFRFRPFFKLINDSAQGLFKKYGNQAKPQLQLTIRTYLDIQPHKLQQERFMCLLVRKIENTFYLLVGGREEAFDAKLKELRLVGEDHWYCSIGFSSIKDLQSCLYMVLKGF